MAENFSKYLVLMEVIFITTEPSNFIHWILFLFL